MPMAEPRNSSLESFTSYIPANQSPAESTFRALALGAILGILFGAASVYLGLRVGLTTSASIPIAVMAITILKKLRGNTVLENNIVQTVGSAGESVAAAVVFTVPALIFLGFPLKTSITLLIAFTGGILGVLMMIPLRRYLIVKEHGNLRFPEGTACAEIIKEGEVGGTSASKIFKGIGLGALWKGLPTLFGFWKPSVGADIPRYAGASIGMDVAPELMGVGYIIGWETSLIMVGGGLMASFIISPIIAFIGAKGGVGSSTVCHNSAWAMSEILKTNVIVTDRLDAAARKHLSSGGKVLLFPRHDELQHCVKGAFTTDFLRWLVRDEGKITLEEAHYRLSALPAHAAGFRDRGPYPEAETPAFFHDRWRFMERMLAAPAPPGPAAPGVHPHRGPAPP